MSADGEAQFARLLRAVADISLAEVLSSPLQRALQAAQMLGQHVGIDVARDHRLKDFDLGSWEGMAAHEAVASAEYEPFLSSHLGVTMPGGESFQDVKKRAVAAIEQAIEDNPSGATIAAVTHARVIRVLLTHYMAAPPATFHRLRIFPATASVLSFVPDSHLPRVVALNWAGELGPLLDGVEQPI